MRYCCLILFFWSLNLSAQTIVQDNLVLNTGLVLQFGTHINGIGLSLKAGYHAYFCQINAGTTITYNFSHYGNREKFWESRNYLGVLLLGGKKDNSFDFQFDGLLHQTNFRNAIGYNYLWYYDQAGTSQRSGGWSLAFNKFTICFENDVFGGQAKDRFRSGHLWFNYRLNNFKFGAELYIWTGETSGSPWNHTSLPDCPNGYRLLEDLPYGRTSHGILYGTIQYNLGFGQVMQLKTGIDSEQIRHKTQNRFAHDLPFLPKSFPRNTPHYPRLDENGCPVFEKKYIRKHRFYFELGTNYDQ